MQPLARNVDFYGFLPTHSTDKTVQSSLHFANAVFLLQGKAKSYGRPSVYATENDEAGSVLLDKGTVVWGKDDSKVAELLSKAIGFVVVFTKEQLGAKAQAQVNALKSVGKTVYELSAITTPHRLYSSASGHVLQSWGVVDGKKAFTEVVAVPVKPVEKKRNKKKQPRKLTPEQAKQEAKNANGEK
jgi:hypothetical protein